MNWRELIEGIYATRTIQPGIASKPEFYAAASAMEIADAEVHLGARFPASIRSLLLETNGVMEMMAIDGGEWFECTWLLWQVTEIAEENHRYRAGNESGTYSTEFRTLVFFANAGCDGILFGFRVDESGSCGPTVVVWRPIEDELVEVARSLEEFLKEWLTGSITV